MKWIDRIIDGMAWLAGLLLVFMMFSICYEVILRYFAFRPPTWVTEITEYILLYATFLGSPWVLKEEGHVKVDIIVNLFRPGPQKVMEVVTSLIAMAVCCVLVWYGTETTWDNFVRGIPVIKSLSVPKFLLLGVIPLGSLFLVIQFVRRSRGLWMAFRRTGPPPQSEGPQEAKG